METRKNEDGSKYQIPLTSGILAPTANKELPSIQNYVRILSRNLTGRFTLQHGENKFYSSDHIFTEPGFFDVFNFKLLKGNSKTALSEPNSVILTETSAKKFFGDENPIFLHS